MQIPMIYENTGHVGEPLTNPNDEREKEKDAVRLLKGMEGS